MTKIIRKRKYYLIKRTILNMNILNVYYTCTLITKFNQSINIKTKDANHLSNVRASLNFKQSVSQTVCDMRLILMEQVTYVCLINFVYKNIGISLIAVVEISAFVLIQL